MKRFKFNNQYLEDLGLIVVEGSNEVFTQEDYEIINVEGRNGSLLINKGTYTDIEKSFIITAINFIDEDDIEEMINNIKKMFFDITDNRLFYISDKKYNIVKKVILGDVRTTFEEFGDFEVTFICEPFYYEVENDLEIIKSSSTSSMTTLVFENEGDFESNPIITVFGAGDVEFILNDDIIKIDNVTTSVTIDTKLLLCYDSKGDNKIKDFLVDFPTLKKGSNTLSIDNKENISKIIITKRSIYR